MRLPRSLVSAAFVLLGTLVVTAGAVRIGAQTALASLGLTEAAARTFVLDEIETPATFRGNAIAVAGTRAFFKLPRAARGPAATALFAWAKTYTSSPAFAASYATYRNGRLPSGFRQYSLTVEQAVKKEIDDLLAGFAQMETAIPSMPEANRAAMREQIAKARANFADPAFIQQRQEQEAQKRAADNASVIKLAAEVEEEAPADPKKLFARRLREFLDVTADVNFSARTITLTLDQGADGIEFVDKADRARYWIWQAAAIAGPEATSAARAAAEAWLKEIGQ